MQPELFPTESDEAPQAKASEALTNTGVRPAILNAAKLPKLPQFSLTEYGKLAGDIDRGVAMSTQMRRSYYASILAPSSALVDPALEQPIRRALAEIEVADVDDYPQDVLSLFLMDHIRSSHLLHFEVAPANKNIEQLTSTWIIDHMMMMHITDFNERRFTMTAEIDMRIKTFRAVHTMLAELTAE